MDQVHVATIVLAATLVAAQGEEAKPGAALHRLHIWLGDWVYEVQQTDGAPRADVPVRGTATLTQMGAFYVFRSESRGVRTLTVWGYDHEKNRYVGESFGSTGYRATGLMEFTDHAVISETVGTTPAGARSRFRCSKELVSEPHEVCEKFKDGHWTPSPDYRNSGSSSVGLLIPPARLAS